MLQLLLALAATPAFAAKDNQIISEIHHKNQGEISLSQLAEDRSTNDSVLGLARRIVDDHKKADQKAMDLASRNKLMISSLPTTNQETQDQSQLSSLMGADFDREYLSIMEKGHADVIAWLDKTKKDVKNPGLKKYISEIMPTLHKHHDLALSVQKKVDATG